MLTQQGVEVLLSALILVVMGRCGPNSCRNVRAKSLSKSSPDIDSLCDQSFRIRNGISFIAKVLQVKNEPKSSSYSCRFLAESRYSNKKNDCLLKND